MKILYPKYVGRAKQWTITTLTEDPKSKKVKQENLWFETEAVAIAEYRRLYERCGKLI